MRTGAAEARLGAFTSLSIWLGRFVRVEPGYSLSVSTNGAGSSTGVSHRGSLDVLARF